MEVPTKDASCWKTIQTCMKMEELHPEMSRSNSTWEPYVTWATLKCPQCQPVCSIWSSLLHRPELAGINAQCGGMFSHRKNNNCAASTSPCLSCRDLVYTIQKAIIRTWAFLRWLHAWITLQDTPLRRLSWRAKLGGIHPNPCGVADRALRSKDQLDWVLRSARLQQASTKTWIPAQCRSWREAGHMSLPELGSFAFLLVQSLRHCTKVFQGTSDIHLVAVAVF